MNSFNPPQPYTNGTVSPQAAKRRAAWIEFLGQVPLFGGLSDAELESVAGDFAPRQFRQGESIFHEGDPGQVLYLIESGQVRIYVQSLEGQETSVVLYGPGDLFGELAVIDGQPRSASAMAMMDTMVQVLERDCFHRHMRRSPQLAYNFMRALSVRIRYSTRHVGGLTLLDVPARLARKLLDLSQDYGRVESNGVTIDAPITQTDLATLTGSTRESVNKALSTFRRQGWVQVDQGRITILDAEALREQIG